MFAPLYALSGFFFTFIRSNQTESCDRLGSHVRLAGAGSNILAGISLKLFHDAACHTFAPESRGGDQQHLLPPLVFFPQRIADDLETSLLFSMSPHFFRQVFFEL